MRASAFVMIAVVAALGGCGGDSAAPADPGDVAPFGGTGGSVAPPTGGTGGTTGGTSAPVGGTMAPPTGGTMPIVPVDAGTDAGTDAGADAGTDASTGDDGGSDPCGDGVVEGDEVCDPALQKCCLRDCSGASPVGAICRPRAGDCDVNDRCDGSDFDCPSDELRPNGYECRAASGECDVAEECTGTSAACPSDAFRAANEACGDTVTDTECDKPDTCNGSGACNPRFVAEGAQCTDTDTTDCNDAECNGGGACIQDHDIEAALTPCGFSTDTDCDDPDTCDAAGNCLSRFVAEGAQCADTNVDDCADAQCDGGGGCVQDYDDEDDEYPCDGSSGTCWAGLCCQGATVDPEHDGACDLEAPEDDLVFVTSSSSTGGSYGSLGGADAQCNALAAAANLEGSYVAWLSSSTTDAVNRIADGPFVRVDGVTVANDVADLVNGTIDNSISKTEFDDVLSISVWTGTAAAGTVDGGANHCTNWTDGATDGMSGASGAVDATWTNASAHACVNSQALYCFQLDCPGMANVDFANDPDNCGGCGNVCGSGMCANGACVGIVFVTSAGYPGNLLGGTGGGGVLDGDAICEMHAASALGGPLPGTYTAWLSGFDPDAGVIVDAADRIDDQPYMLLDGTLVAPNGLVDLTTASLTGPIDIDETYDPLNPATRTAYVWTGTAPDGTAASPRCSEWTSGSLAEPGVGGYTSSGASDPYWTDRGGAPFPFSPYPCNQTHTLYCFQNLP